MVMRIGEIGESYQPLCCERAGIIYVETSVTSYITVCRKGTLCIGMMCMYYSIENVKTEQVIVTRSLTFESNQRAP